MKTYVDDKLKDIVFEKLIRENVDERIICNPRATEIIQVVIEQVITELEQQEITQGSTEYLVRMIPLVKARLTMLAVTEKGGGIECVLPAKMLDSKQEMRKYEITENNELKRMIKFTERGQFKETRISYINQQGIETEKDIYISGKGVLTLERMQGHPHIIVGNLNGAIEYFDISKLQYPEDIEIEGAIRIKQEEINKISEIDKIRIVEKAQNTVYADGVKEMYGMNIQKDENIQEEVK